MPWPPVQLTNLLSRLLNVVIDLVTTVLGQKRALTYAQQTLLAAETSDATNAAQADGNNMLNVCQELLIKHPYSMSTACVTATDQYVEGKYHTITKKIMDAAVRGTGGTDVADAVVSLDAKKREYRTALSQPPIFVGTNMVS